MCQNGGMGENNSQLQGEIVSVENPPVLSAENPERERVKDVSEFEFLGLWTRRELFS